MAEFFITELREGDLPALAVHWKHSIKGWPPGFEAEIGDCSEDSIREWLMRRKYLAVWLGWLGDEIVSFLSYSRYYNESDVTYVDLFNAHPGYHGKGYGRALLVKSVEKAVEDNVKRLDLHTWSANLKAVPLYKKCGFFWRPNTQVHMYCFLPPALNHPFVKEFIGDAHWYELLKQPLDVSESDDVYEGCHYHRYILEKGGKRMEVYIDPSTSGVAGIVSDDIAVKCEIPGETHIAGIPQSVRWIFKSEKNEPVRVIVSCEPDESLDYSFSEEFDLKGEKVINTILTPKSDLIPERVSWAGKNLICKVEVNNREAVFMPGIRAVRPFEINSSPNVIRMVPGEEKEIVLNLNSRMKKDSKFTPELKVEGDITLLEEPGLETIEIPSESSFGLMVKVRAGNSEGTGRLSVGGRLEVGDNTTDIHPLEVFAGIAPTGKPIEIPDNDPDIRKLGNGRVSVKGRTKGGNVEIFLRDADNPSWWFYCDRIGEPFSDEFMARDYEIAVEIGEYESSLVFSVESNDFPGIRLERRVSIGTGNDVLVTVKVFNEGEKPFNGRVRYKPAFRDFGTAYVPLGGMIVKGSKENFVTGPTPLPVDASEYSEPWIAWERLGGGQDETTMSGIVFPGATHCSWDWGTKPALEYDVVNLAPGKSTTLPTLRLMTGAKNLQEIQRTALEGKQTSLPGKPRFFIHAESPIFVGDDNPVITCRMMRTIPSKGRVSLTLPDGRTVEESKEKWVYKDPMTPELADIDASESGLIAVDYKLQGMYMEFGGRLPLFVPERGKTISIDKGKEGEYEFFKVDNGVVEFNVGPKFCGSMYRFAEKSDPEKNLLRTSWPKPGMWTWWNPWFGGAKLYSWDDSPFHKSEFEGDAVKIMWSGFEWQGVRVTVRLPKQYRSLLIELLYLTRPGIPVVLNLLRFTEQSGNSRPYGYEYVIFPDVTGDPDVRAEARMGEVDGPVRLESSEAGTIAGTGNWIAITDPRNGKTLACIQTRGGGVAWDAGKDGLALFHWVPIHTLPDRVVELAVMHVIADSPDLIEVLAEQFAYLDRQVATEHPVQIGSEMVVG